LGDVYSVKDWFINVNTMDISNMTGGSLKKGSKYRIFSYQKMTSL
jgi:hypothetical protein